MRPMKRALSPRELAEAVGVSESSIKRWADHGVVRVVRTAGGHRRIPVEEAVRFVRTSQLKLVRPEVLGLKELAAVAAQMPAQGEEAERLFAYLRAGAGLEARGLILSLYLDGASAAEIVDGPLKGAMERLGELWRHSEKGVFAEHRATDIAIQALSQLRAMLPAPPAGAPVAVGGAPPRDPYILPSLGVAAVLRDSGIAATNLGPQTPPATLLQALQELSPRLVWLSVSVEDIPADLASQLEPVLERVASLGATFLLGGRQRRALRLRPRPSLYAAASMAELAAFTRGLTQAPGPE